MLRPAQGHATCPQQALHAGHAHTKTSLVRQVISQAGGGPERERQTLKDRKVLVLGGGTMGLLIALAAKTHGAGSLTLSDPFEAKQVIARQVGIEDARGPSDLGDDSFDVVFEAAGVPASLHQALGLVEKTGVLVQVGVHDADATAGFNPFKLYEREMRFIGSNSCADQFEPPVDLMMDLRDKAAVLIGESFPV